MNDGSIVLIYIHHAWINLNTKSKGIQMFEWLKKKLHKHEMIWTSREVVGYTSVDTTVGRFIDIEPATIYLMKGYCLKCNSSVKERRIIMNVFDEPQPYDNKPKG